MGLTASIIHSGRQRGVQIGVQGAVPDGLRWLEDFPGARRTYSSIYIPYDFFLMHHIIETAGEPIALSGELQHTYEQGKEWIEQRRRLTALEDAELESYPLANELYPFQRAGAFYLKKATRTILGDEAGLGKTALCIAAAYETGQTDRILVLCNNTHKWWWRDEICSWAGEENPLITVVEASTRRRDLAQWKRDGGWLIVNWELLRLMPVLESIQWQWLMADEAHKVKNRETQRFKAIKKLRTNRLVLVTASPRSNHAAELWTLLNLCRPDWFTSYWRFYELFVDYTKHWMGYRQVQGDRNPDLLAYVLSGFMRRCYKEDVGQWLPAKTHTRLPLQLTPRQQVMYSQMAKEMLVQLESGEELEAMVVVAQITRLRQITSGSSTLEDTDHSCKLDAVMALIAERLDRKTVVFTQFRPTVDALMDRLVDAKIEASSLMGGMNTKSVAHIVAEFQDNPRPRVLVATTGAGGESHTLTAADTVIFVEQHWNPERQAQAEDRVHRIGQANPVQIITLYCPGTIDDVVENTNLRKLSMSDKVLHHAILADLQAFLSLYGKEKGSATKG